MKRSTRAPAMDKAIGERGIALLIVLFAISAFSALSVTVLTDKALEATLVSGGELTVSGPGKVASSPKVPWSVRITRTDVGESELQVRTMLPVGSVSEEPVGASSQPGGWISVVQVTPGVRVCCDGGDGLCRNQPREATSVTEPDPSMNVSLSSVSPTQSLVFSLITGTEPPAAGAANPSFLYTVNAKPQPPNVTAQVQDAIGQSTGGGIVVCQLERSDGTLAQGLIRLQQALPQTGDGSDAVLEGTLTLDYVRPSGLK